MTWRWLESTEALQRDYFNVDPRGLTGEEQADYVRWNVLAAVAELTEFLQETAWKPWATGEKGVLNHEAAIVELVDVAHFVANLALTCGATDEQWERLYQEKQQKNRDRMSSGTYNGRDSKCPACDADYNDNGVACRPEVSNDVTGNVDPWCSKYGGYVTGRPSTVEEHARISRG